ncbi:hypothetical protein C8D88_106158 [Lentzea atacamensis]|uniref:Heptaprenyl diphosphate synthase n=1 Tax=Lentzea atacamensis TaxID=531938 RepID=A0A316IE35_9PSEU|nr:hypothetical protein [Lentzea atacamensis]PWK85530.1 hypothetical protein C8D88_106158 [Lentzea atacamensis]
MITPATRLVDEQTHALRDALTTALRSITTDLPHLAAKVTTRAARFRNTISERVFAAVVAAARGENPKKALPLCVASALWWISAESDAAGAQCGAVLAMRHLKSVRAPDNCMLGWFDEIARSTTSAIETRLAEHGRTGSDISRKAVLANNLGIAGAAYARDAAMATHLTDGDAIDEWRRFGALYGAMRQLHADHVRSTVDLDDHPRLVVPPLLLAHAFQQGNTGLRQELARLLRSAPSGAPGCHAVLRDLLRSPRTVAAYARDLRRLHGKACDLLDGLSAAAEARAALRSILDSTLALPMPGTRELIGV